MSTQPAANMIAITVNGEARKLSEKATVVDLLHTLAIDPEQSGIAVALDQSVVTRSKWKETQLSEGATVEVITATQGG